MHYIVALHCITLYSIPVQYAATHTQTNTHRPCHPSHRAEMPGAVHGILSARGLRDISNQFAAVEVPSNGLNIRKLAPGDSIDPRLQVAFPGPSGYEISGWWYPVRTPPKTFQK